MARILIEDLPADTDLTTEELEQIHGGAGRPSFRPTLEGLEGREMCATDLFVGLSQSGKLVVRGTSENDVVALRRVGTQIEVLNGPEQVKAGSFDANKVRSINLLMDEGQDRVDLTGLGKMNEGLVSYHGLGTTEVRYTDPAGRNVVDRWQGIDVGNLHTMKLVSLDATTADGAKVHGEWQRGQWVENADHSGSASKFQVRKDVFESPDGKLLSRRALLKDGNIVFGEWKEGRWVETTSFADSPPGSLKSRIDTFDKPDGNLLSSRDA